MPGPTTPTEASELGHRVLRSVPTTVTPELVHFGAVAKGAGCSRATVYRLWHTGRLPLEVLDIGTGDRPRPRVRRSDLNRWLGIPDRPLTDGVSPQVGAAAWDGASDAGGGGPDAA
jgi:hypothetical protein